MQARLYVIPGSHPSRTVQAMLERKRIDYKRVDLMPVISKGVVRLAGFPGITVPALKGMSPSLWHVQTWRRRSSCLWKSVMP